MRYCDDKECEETACCNHCIYLKEEDYEFTCRLYNEEVYPNDICDDFVCYRNYS